VVERTINYIAEGVDDDGELVRCDCHSENGAKMFVDGLRFWVIKDLAGNVVDSESWYVAERNMWHAEVRFVRTTSDRSGVVGLTSDKNAGPVAAVPELVRACALFLMHDSAGAQAGFGHEEVKAAIVAAMDRAGLINGR